MKFWPLSAWLCNILCEEMEVPIKHFCCTSKYDGCLEKRTIFELPIFFTDTVYTWHKIQLCGYDTNTQLVGIWHIIPKMDSGTVISRKTMTIFITNDKIWTFKQALEFRTTCIHHCKRDGFSIFNGFSDEIGSMLSNVGFFFHIV